MPSKVLLGPPTPDVPIALHIQLREAVDDLPGWECRSSTDILSIAAVLTESQAYMVILGHCYGTPLADGLSITEAAWNEARRQQKARRAFALHDDFPGISYSLLARGYWGKQRMFRDVLEQEECLCVIPAREGNDCIAELVQCAIEWLKRLTVPSGPAATVESFPMATRSTDENEMEPQTEVALAVVASAFRRVFAYENVLLWDPLLSNSYPPSSFVLPIDLAEFKSLECQPSSLLRHVHVHFVNENLRVISDLTKEAKRHMEEAARLRLKRAEEVDGIEQYRWEKRIERREAMLSVVVGQLVGLLNQGWIH